VTVLTRLITKFGTGRAMTTAHGRSVCSNREPKRYHRQSQVNWFGWAVYIFYILAFGFYMWVRITKTLDLGSYLWYGIIVLAVEILGATTVFLYGTNLLYNPVLEKPAADAEPESPGGGPPRVKASSHAHGPTQRSSSIVVRLTVQAPPAHRAAKPSFRCL
jgi:endoglucanase